VVPAHERPQPPGLTLESDAKGPRGKKLLTDEELRLIESLDPTRLPRHIAVIMDGNRRWAKGRNFSALRGHQIGARASRRVIEVCIDIHIEALTLYTFSTENWKRPKLEVDALMRLIEWNLKRELPQLKKSGVQVKHIGMREGLPAPLLDQIDRSVNETSGNNGMLLNLAVNYGGRREITDATRAIAADVAAGRLAVEDIDEAAIARRLYTRGETDPDLLVRTGGEMRISNFLPWQIAYAELWVTPVYWPDFQKSDLLRAIVDYQSRDRRFGSSTGVPSQERTDREKNRGA